MKVMGPTVSVLVPTWKRPEKLRRCLRALLEQDSAPEEIIVTYRSEDSQGQEVLASMRPLFAGRLRPLLVEREGVVHAENQAMKEARGEVLAFIDDDAYAPRDWVHHLRAFFAANPRAGGLGGPDRILGDPDSYDKVEVDRVGLVLWYGKVLGRHHHRVRGGLREVHVLKGVNMAVRRQFARPLDERGLSGHGHGRGNGAYWELDFCLRARALGARLYFDPALVVQHDSNHDHFIPEEVMRNASFNLAWVLWGHLSWPRRCLFLVYACLIGNTQHQGIFKTLALWAGGQRPNPWKFFRLSMGGLLSGILARLSP